MTDPSALMPAGDRRVHRALLDAMLTTGAVPSTVELAGSLGLSLAELAAHLDALAEVDYLGRNETGAITCLYPFSAVPTPHVVAIADVRRFAMCSIDALGMATMLGQAVVIASSCAGCGVAIRVEVEPGRIVSADPAESVVIARRSGNEPACETCCPFTLFACGPAHGEAVAAQAPETAAVPLAEALPHADAIFAGFFGETLPAKRPRSETTLGRLRT